MNLNSKDAYMKIEPSFAKIEKVHMTWLNITIQTDIPLMNVV